MVSIVATVWNEESSLEGFLRALLAQTLPPDEIVIADGGSTDGTPGILRRLAAEDSPVRPVFLPRSNRSVGRNAAIEAARGEIIAMTDAGSQAAKEWLERITAPLREDAAVDVAGGYYEVVATEPMPMAIAAATVVPVEAVDPATFLPSSRSVAFRKDAWAKVGGYPEWADHNEDTVFVDALRRAGCRFTFVPDAIVSWEPAGDLGRLFHQFYRYARGDAQAGLFFRHYYKNYAIPAVAATWVLGRRRPALRWMAGAAAGLYLGKQCLRAARRTPCGLAVALTPAVVLTLDLAHLAGYVVGVFDRPAIARRKGERQP